MDAPTPPFCEIYCKYQSSSASGLETTRQRIRQENFHGWRQLQQCSSDTLNHKQFGWPGPRSPFSGKKTRNQESEAMEPTCS